MWTSSSADIISDVSTCRLFLRLEEEGLVLIFGVDECRPVSDCAFAWKRFCCCRFESELKCSSKGGVLKINSRNMSEAFRAVHHN